MNGNINNVTRQGYTLLEIIVVLVLIGILMSISIPSIKIIRNIEEKEEINIFRRDIISAKNKSITEGTIYILNIEANKNSYNITNGGDIIKEVKFVHWQIMPGNTFGNEIKFYATGSPNKGGSLELKNKKNKIIKLSVVPVTGKLNVYENE